MKIKQQQVRYFFVITFVFVLFGVIVWRLLDLSYFSRGRYIDALTKTRKSEIIIPARRGTIFDRNLEILAVNETKVTIGVDPYAANLEKDLQKICSLVELLGLNYKTVLEKFIKKREVINNKSVKRRWVPIGEIVGDSLYSAVKNIKINGVYGIKRNIRTYPIGHQMCHVTGFINRDGVPVCGIERYADFYLRGQDGYIKSEKDGHSQEMAQYRTHEVASKDGNDVVLTVDKNIQEFVCAEIDNLVNQFSPHSVSIIVSEVATGDIIAMANYPNYDPNNYGKFPIENIKNLAVSNVYEPGSVFKIVAMSFGLERGLVDEETIYDCTQTTIVNRGQTINLPHDHTAFDKLTFVDAVRKSSNRAVVQTAMMLGEADFYNCVKLYGFGVRSGYGFDGESGGIFPTLINWDAWTISRMPMGYSIGAVPLQTHYAMSVIANDGLLLKPNIIRYVQDGNTKIFTSYPTVRHRVISQLSAIRMRNVLCDPEKNKLDKNIYYGGKSGTGQKIINGKYSHERHISSYSGFFPAKLPKFVITVIVDDAKPAKGTAWGSVVALPAFKKIANKMIQHLDL